MFGLYSGYNYNRKENGNYYLGFRVEGLGFCEDPCKPAAKGFRRSGGGNVE